jgi:hypothetical protein
MKLSQTTSDWCKSTIVGHMGQPKPDNTWHAVAFSQHYPDIIVDDRDTLGELLETLFPKYGHKLCNVMYPKTYWQPFRSLRSPL